MPRLENGLFAVSDQEHAVLSSFGTITGWMAREFPDEDLFVYYHRKHRTFTVAVWVNRTAGIFKPLLVIGREGPGDFTRQDARSLRLRLRSREDSLEKAKEDSLSAARAQNRLMTENHRVVQERYKYVRRHMRSKAKRDHPLLQAMAGDTVV